MELWKTVYEAPKLGFIDSVKNNKTKKKLLLLEEIIDEMMFLEAYVSGAKEMISI